MIDRMTAKEYVGFGMVFMATTQIGESNALKARIVSSDFADAIRDFLVKKVSQTEQPVTIVIKEVRITTPTQCSPQRG